VHCTALRHRSGCLHCTALWHRSGCLHCTALWHRSGCLITDPVFPSIGKNLRIPDDAGKTVPSLLGTALYCPLRCTALHALRCTALHCPQKCTALHFNQASEGALACPATCALLWVRQLLLGRPQASGPGSGGQTACPLLLLFTGL
jgi:hypothetical protein